MTYESSTASSLLFCLILLGGAATIPSEPARPTTIGSEVYANAKVSVEHLARTCNRHPRRATHRSLDRRRSAQVPSPLQTYHSQYHKG